MVYNTSIVGREHDGIFSRIALLESQSLACRSIYKGDISVIGALYAQELLLAYVVEVVVAVERLVYGPLEIGIVCCWGNVGTGCGNSIAVFCRSTHPATSCHEGVHSAIDKVANVVHDNITGNLGIVYLGNLVSTERTFKKMY